MVAVQSYSKLFIVFIQNHQSCVISQCQSFTKNFSDTSLHVYWTGVLRIYACDSCCKRWHFTFDGVECTAPLPIDGLVYMQTGKNQNIHRVRHIEGHCHNIHKGKVSVGFWVGNCASYENANAYTGWNSVSRIYVEEVPKPHSRDKTSIPATALKTGWL